jgi:hypothetical protein
MRVDEARCDATARRIDARPGLGIREVADRDHAVVDHADIGAAARGAGPVDHIAAMDHDIVCLHVVPFAVAAQSRPARRSSPRGLAAIGAP